jgi:hypothetical protein
MTGTRVQASLPVLAFALLAAGMAIVGGVSAHEAAWAAASVAAALLPSGWASPSGWRRRAAEAMVLPAGLALVMVGDPTQRRMILPVLLVLLALAAAAAALARADACIRPFLIASLAVAARAAGGLGLAGIPLWHAGAVVLAAAAVAWAAARLAPGAGPVVALTAGILPLERAPLWVLPALLAGAAIAGAVSLRRRFACDRLRGWSAGAVAAAAAAAALAPWGGIAVPRALPGSGWGTAAAALGALAVTPFLSAGPAGAVWLAATLAAGAAQPPPPDYPAVRLTAASPKAELPTSSGGMYALDLSLANGAGVATGEPVATVFGAGPPLLLRAGIDAVEWARERADVRAVVKHTLPATPVWRPTGVGRTAVWGVAGHREAFLPAGTHPTLVRSPSLPANVVLIAAAAGPEKPTPPRDWPLPAWLLAAAAVVAALQVTSRTWGTRGAWLPWALLAGGSLLARLAVEPLRLLAERHAVDIALAAVLAAWLPAAAAWLRRRRAFLTAAALLLPLALATPHLTPSLYGDEPYHLIILQSLARDHDLDLSNNLDLEHHPYNRIYIGGFMQPPVLAMLLLPGYLVDGRAGALALLALAGAGVIALLARRARELGCARSRVALLVTLLAVTLPLATYSTQIWVEVPGALAAAASVVLLASPRPRRGAIAALAALGSAVKLRLGLVLFPLTAVAWWPARLHGREVRRAIAVVGGVTVLGLAVSWATFGRPLGYRHLSSFIPKDPRIPLHVIGGLLFDPAGGLAFSAPLLMLALGGAAALWRRGGAGERALLVGGAVTLLALLHSFEWYGGGSPPGRYLVPLLPAFALAGAMLLVHAPRWRRLAWPLLPASVLAWWVLATRPQFSVNPGDGGWWLADALARRFSADARHLVPSFLRPSPATIVVPALIVLATAAAVVATVRSAGAGRALARAAVTCTVLVATGFVLVLTLRTDRVVEIEDPQVERIGGRPEPPPGTFSRFLHPQGWRIASGEGVVVPLNLPAHARVRVEGWLDGQAREGCAVLASWDGGASERTPVRGVGEGWIRVPNPPAEGHHRLRLVLDAPGGGEAVLDRLQVTR